MIQVLLFLLRLFRGWFTRAGVDYLQLESIARYRLTVDGRKNKRLGNQAPKGKEQNNTQLKMGLWMFLMSGIYFFFFSSKTGEFGMLLFYHSFLLVMMVMMILQEYGDMVFDVTDNQILMRMPVNPRTLWSAKIICLVYYFLFFALCALLLPFAMLWVLDGFLYAAAFLLAGLCNALFSLLVVNLIYLGMLRFLSTARFQQMIGGVRMAIGIGVMVGYMLLMGERTVEIGHGSWELFVPPAWFAAFNEIFSAPLSTVLLVEVLLGITLPVVTVWITLKWLVPFFSRKAAGLDPASYYAPPAALRRSGKQRSARWIPSALFTRNSLSQSGFRYCWMLSSGNRYFREMILPMSSFLLVMIGMQAYQFIKNGSQEELGVTMLLIPYMTVMIALVIVEAMQYTKSGHLLPFYRSKPMQYPGLFILGAFKAVYVRYFVPCFVLPAGLLLVVGGWGYWLDVVYCFCVITLIVLIQTRFSPAFPFSREAKMMQKTKYVFFFLLVVIVAAVLGVVQFFLGRVTYGLPIATGVLLLLLWWVGRSFRSIRWSKIEAVYNK